MLAVLPKALQELIDAFAVLPGVGPRSAERFALYLLQADPRKTKNLARAAENLHDAVAYCQKTFVLVEKGQDISTLYSDPSRDKQVVAVVEDAFDVVALEKTGLFKGTYHVLGGLINPLDNIGPEQLTIDQLVTRVDEDLVKELVIATNASVEGESTALYIQRQLTDSEVKITRLARGLPVGVDLDYADLGTLGRALENRTVF
jgi:recombination protein RecR